VSRRTEMVMSGGLHLALHTLADGDGRPLLILHGLGEHAPEERPVWTDGWPGPVLALDFTGHGESEVPVGGGYMPESLMADVDVVLTTKGPCTIVGRGLGAWVALLISGARPELVHGAVLADGSGIAGGGPQPPSPYVEVLPAGVNDTPDPFALLELSRDVRPPDYALDFVRFAIEGSTLENPIVVSARIRPDWLAAVASELDVLDLSLTEAVARFAAL
jgi:pimeloyl-ACP methyl ester carboxylesterase